MIPFRRISLLVGFLLVAHGGPAGGADRSESPVAGEVVRAGTAPAPATGTRLADLGAFRNQVLARDKSYAAAARAEAEKRLAALESSAAEVSPAGFELELARIVALADNGHTAYFPGPRSRRYNRAPIRLVPFGGDFHVLRARSDHVDLLGARLLSIDGRPIGDLRSTARTLQGGTPAWRDRNAGYFFESPEQLHALGASRSPDAATYAFLTLDGRQVERRIAAEPADPGRLRANADRWMWPAPMEKEDGDWRALLRADRAPWSLQEPDAPFRLRDAPDLDAVVADLRQNNDAEKIKIMGFLKAVEQERVQRHRRHIVLDMRFNGGGDLTTTAEFMRAWPDRVGPDGRFFVLTSPWTFSAGISSIGYLKQAGRERVTIIGEPVGDRLMFFAEGNPVTLPSGIVISLATERHDYRTGCRDFTDCHRNVVKRPIALESLEPGIAAPWTIEAYVAGRDPGMEAVAAALPPS